MTDLDAWLTFAVGSSETEPGGEEGGWNPTDPSPENPTWRGIEFEEYCDWLVIDPFSLPFSAFRLSCTRTRIGQIAGQNYWQKFRVDLLPSGPNVLFMDGVFNGGGVENLQVAMNEIWPPFPPLQTDDVFGPLTLTAMGQYLPTANAYDLIGIYAAVAEARYRELAKQPRFAPHLDGWLGRLGRCKALALGLVTA